MKKSKIILFFILSLISFFLIWDLISNLYNPILFPKTQIVFKKFIIVLTSSDTYSNLWASIILVMEGFLLSIIIAFPVSILSFKSKIFSNIAIPYHEFMRYIPVPALVPVCLVIFGVGDFTKIILVFIGTYFQVLFLFISDFKISSKGYEESAKTLGLKGVNLVLKINIPASLPRLLDSLRISFAWAWSYLLVAEVINSEKGIGYLVLQSYRVLDMPRLISYLIIIGLFGLLMDFIFKFIRLKSCPYIIK